MNIFLYPYWLIGLPFIWIYSIYKYRQGTIDAWKQVMDAPLRALLQLPEEGSIHRRPWVLLGVIWTLSIIALAGPSLRQPLQPAFQSQSAWVVLLNLSSSMNANDVKPNRITQARFALEALLNQAQDHRIALLVWTDDPYPVSPLTSDIQTIRQFLPELVPAIMPSNGRQLTPALLMANNMLHQIPNVHHHIIVLGDGLDDPQKALGTVSQFRKQGIEVDVVGTGTVTGAPLSDVHGQWVKSNGQPVLTQLPLTMLQSLAKAGGGMYVDSHQLSPLLQHLQQDPLVLNQHRKTQSEIRENDGFWLMPIILLCSAVVLGTWI